MAVNIPLSHQVVKVPGQTLAAVADWNANHQVTANLDIGAYNFTTTGIITGGTFNATDEDNVLQVDGGIILKTGVLAENNIFIGLNSGNITLTGTDNYSIGTSSMSALTSGSANVGMGNTALSSVTTGSANFALGHSALRNITTGISNVGIGSSAGVNLGGVSGTNVMIGDNTGVGNGTNVTHNVLIGSRAGRFVAGDRNVGIGTFALESLTSGDYNLAIGYAAGRSITSGTRNVFLGFSAGLNQTVASNLLIIDNQDRGNVANELAKCLIYGVFDADPANQTLRFNAGVSSGTTTLSAVGPTDNVDVKGVNTLFINTSGNNVTIGGFINGVVGQVLHVVIIDPTNNTTLEHIEGTGNQDIYLHAGADETLDAHYGGWILVCNGTHWFDASHSKHV